jgi:general secretion pathway protein B
MSLILEALRRSEAERQLGRAPDVLAPMPVLRVSRPTRHWPWWTALALLLTALAVWGMWRYAQPHGPAATTAAAGTQFVAAAPPRITMRPLQEDASQTHPAIIATNATPIVLRQSPPTMPRTPAMNTVPPITAGLSSDVAATAAAARVATPPPAPVVPPPEPTAAEAPLASPDALLSIGDLSPGERASLPALKVSMHVYAEQPGNRFMIIDGTRVGEGARIGDRIVLVQIRRDGGVLDIGGRRVLLPKP